MDKTGYGFFNCAIIGEKDYKTGKEALKGANGIDKKSIIEQLKTVDGIVQKYWKKVITPQKGSDAPDPLLNKSAPDNLKNLTRRLKENQNVAFLPMPSSSGTNALPIAFANCLAAYFREKEGINTSRIPDIDRYAVSSTLQSIKTIPELIRWGIADKEYTIDEETLPSLKRKLKLKNGALKYVYIVDDKMSSGASTYAFIRALEANGITISGVIALSGYNIFGKTKKIQQRLDGLLEKNSISGVSSKEMMDVSAPSEINAFSDFLSLAQSIQEQMLKAAALKMEKSARLNNTLTENSEKLEAMRSTESLIKYQLNRRKAQAR